MNIALLHHLSIVICQTLVDTDTTAMHTDRRKRTVDSDVDMALKGI
jgi:hypothetical protein